jgi:hypothetical protein
MTPIATNALFNDILEFLVSAPSPEAIIAFKPSPTLEQRSLYLLEQNRHNQLSAEERAELEEMLRLNHFMSMLKIRARQKLAGNA